MSASGEGEEQVCWLCTRPLGRKVQWHHTVPKAKKGKATVPVHPICHKVIHAYWSNAELVRFGDDREVIAGREEVATFLRWVADKPADFNARVRRPRGRL